MKENTPAYDNLDIYNPAPRCPVVLMLDTSISMDGQPIDELNKAVRQFVAETKADEAASMSVELEIITFDNEARVALPFTPMADVAMPIPFLAHGMTSMGAAIKLAERDLQARRDLYRSQGISSYRPWVVLMTDGGPNDSWEVPARRFRTEAGNGKFMYLGLEIGDEADHGIMCKILPAEPGPVKLQGLRFKQFFRWLTDSLKTVSASAVTAQDSIHLPPITSWADLTSHT